MNLIVDVGNTKTKLAVFKGDTMLYTTSLDSENIIKELEYIFKNYTISKAISSSVGKPALKAITYINKHTTCLILDHTLKFPFKNAYSTPHTLGVDRLALTAQATVDYPNTNVLIIDCGTCITYDFINNDNIYLGGGISPGIMMRYKALNHYTNALPLLEKQIPDHYIGDSTNNAIHSGVSLGVVNEIDGIINTYKSEYSSLTIILTGGDAKFLSKPLKSSIFATSNFLLKGLNTILNYNTKDD